MSHLPKVYVGGPMLSARVGSVFIAAAESLTTQIARIDARRSVFPGGRNGPYFDLESPIRNSSHALCTMGIAYTLTDGRQFLKQGQALAQFLLEQHEFIRHGTVVHRQHARKDCCNGVIGPAWLVEGLVVGGHLLDIHEAVRRANVLSESQPFDVGAGLWRRNDPCRSANHLDRTLNHQVYFAAATASAAQTKTGSMRVPRDVTSFLDRLHQGGFQVDQSGQIVHHVASRNTRVTGLSELAERIVSRVRYSPLAQNLASTARGRKVGNRERDAGYHLYSLFALSKLRSAVRGHSFWETESVRKAVSLVVSEGWLDSLEGNRYAYPYNAPGYELPLVAKVFGDYEPELFDVAEEALSRQIESSFDTNSGLFVKSTTDGLTLSARLYELGLSLIPEFPDLVTQTGSS